MGGLATALAFSRNDVDVVIVERDPEPPVLASPEDAFDGWARPGVPQFRHAHILLARLQTIVRDRHPELHAELLKAGLELSSLEEMLPPNHLENYRALPGDEDLRHFWGRRATFEYLLRRHVERLPHVRFVHSAKVTGLKLETSDRAIRARGLELTRAGAPELIEADLVVDASGKRTECPGWLEARGARIRFDRYPSNYLYVCRHYQLDDPRSTPPRHGTGANFDYFGYSTFYGERGHYAITLGCPTDEKDIARSMRKAEGFDAVCAQLPVLVEWTSRSTVKSKVLGATRFENRWTRYRGGGGREILGLFAVGDSHVETNPMYGRGCASAFVQAEALSDVLSATPDPSDRSRRYYSTTRRLLLPHFNFCLSADRMLQSRSKQSRGLPIPAADQFIRHAFEVAWIPAMNKNPVIAREMVKAMEMREISSLGVRLAVLFYVAWEFFSSFFRRTKPAALFDAPPRAEFLGKLAAASPGPIGSDASSSEDAEALG
jgi:2-polyprenyl-6-methoxyphenol hydroxylase-like FAD-dependent oxidoreductase